MDGLHEVSFDSLAHRAKLRQNDDRKEYAAKKKHGKTYRDFTKDDREEYKKRMKYGKHYKG